MNCKKGSSAMEFLLTYGRDILVVMVIIGSLVYFGFVNPELFEEDKTVEKFEWNAKAPDVSHYWVCMDGCFRMGEMLYEEHWSEVGEPLHSRCADWCWEYLIENEGMAYPE
jgi:hypothetical protein